MGDQKTIAFIMGIGPNIPTGGQKVIFDYSDYLIKDGYDVNIVYAAYYNSTEKSLKRKLKAVAKYVYAKIFLSRTGYTWCAKNNGIKEYYFWKVDYGKMPYAYLYIATSVNTAPYVASFPVDISRKIYFIQDYESFVVNNDDFIKSTYHLELRKIVISKWLAKIVENEGENCTIVPNGFDPNTYKITIPINDKDKYLVSMLYHVNARKDVGVGMKAIELAREYYPNLKLLLFGAYPEPENLPDWIQYYRNPSEKLHLQINNRAAIYVGCSKIEGWGLTIGEAMMCGQAVACTDIDGYKEMATNHFNALLSPAGNAETLADNIVKLIKDDELRHYLAQNGVDTITEFSMDKAYEKFKSCLFQPINIDN